MRCVLSSFHCQDTLLLLLFCGAAPLGHPPLGCRAQRAPRLAAVPFAPEAAGATAARAQLLKEGGSLPAEGARLTAQHVYEG